MLYLFDKEGKQTAAFLSNNEDGKTLHCHECGEKLVLSKDSKNLSTIVANKIKNGDYIGLDHPDYDRFLEESNFGASITIENIPTSVYFEGLDTSEIYETDFAKGLDSEIKDIIISKWAESKERKAETLKNIEDSHSGDLIVFSESEINEIISYSRKSWDRRIALERKKEDTSEDKISQMERAKELSIEILRDRISIPNLVSKLFIDQHSILKFTDHFSHAEIKPYGELRKCPLAESDWDQAHEFAKERVRQELSKIYKKKDGYTITGHYKVRDKETGKVLRWSDGAVLKGEEVVFVIEVEHKKISSSKCKEIQDMYRSQNLKCLWIPTIEFEKSNEQGFEMMIPSIYTMMGRSSLIQMFPEKQKYNAPKFMKDITKKSEEARPIIFYSHRDECFYFHDPEMKYVGSVRKEFSVHTNKDRTEYLEKSLYEDHQIQYWEGRGFGNTEVFRTPEKEFICNLYDSRSFIEIDFEDIEIRKSTWIKGALFLSAKKNTTYLPPYDNNGVFNKLHVDNTFFENSWRYLQGKKQFSWLSDLRRRTAKERNHEIADAKKRNEQLMKIGGFNYVCEKYNVKPESLTGQFVKVVKRNGFAQRGDIIRFDTGGFIPDEMSINVSWKGKPANEIKIKSIKEIVLDNGDVVNISEFYNELSSAITISVY